MSAEVLFTIKSIPDNILAYNVNYKSLADILKEIKLTTKFIICVRDDLDDKTYFLNLSLMLREPNSTSGSTTWKEFGEKITEIDIQAYKVCTFSPKYMLSKIDGNIIYEETPKSSNVQGGPKIVSVEHDQYIHVDYGIFDNPTLRNINNLKFMLKDLIYSQINKTVVNFKNCIPIVNGIVNYSDYFDGELYIRDVTKYLYSTSGRAKSLILMDFTDCGGIDKVRLCDCENLTNVLGKSSNLTFRLPKDKTLENKTPIVVLGGRMFFANNYHIIDDRTICIDLANVNFKEILTANMIIEEKFEYNTNIVKPMDVEDYIKDVVFDKENYNNFIAIVNNKYVKPYYIEPLGHISCKDYLFPYHSEGLLIKRSTKEIMDYVKHSLEFNTRVHMNIPYGENLTLRDASHSTHQRGFIKTRTISLDDEFNHAIDSDYRHFDEVYKNLNDYNVALMDIIVQKEKLPENTGMVI